MLRLRHGLAVSCVQGGMNARGSIALAVIGVKPPDVIEHAARSRLAPALP